MNPRRLRHPLTQLFEPGDAPYLFILGSTFLAVLGNGVYELLQDGLGDRPRTRIVIVLGALLIVGIVTLVFVARLRRQAATTLSFVPTEQRADPCPGLVLLLSPGPGTSEEVAIRHHLQRNTLRQCWLIVSEQAQTKAAQLQFDLNEQNVHAHIVALADETQARLSYAAVKGALEVAQTALPGQPVIVDITGGTKPMTAGAVLACLDTGAPLEYIVSLRHPDGSVKTPGPPIKVELL